ncbi:MAG: amino acid permease [Candidatus Lokiarchaeota archaeon]|nr:amino acid permease [Candidatus Lokiarchaeota archaeon]MBD3337781.1 amino acid permease [Candidatus Lokiarchaeota archaeon]
MENNNNEKEGKLRRELGLTSVIFFIFGYVVGAGILIQTGVTAGITGPSLWLAFIIAGIPNVINAIIIAYIVSAFPVSGGAWVYSSRLSSPFLGFLVMASIILHIMGALALLAVGFGAYFELFIPGSLIYVAIASLLIFYVVNIFGVKFAGWVQIVLAIIGDFMVILIFIIFGLPHVDLNKLTGKNTGGMFPTGFLGIFIGAIILSFSYAGFNAIIEIGGEIKNPKRNIPLGLFISFLLIAAVYTLVAIVMTGNMDWNKLGQTEGTIIDVASLFFPLWFISILTILILIAIASTIHGIILAWSRDLFSAARDFMVPSGLAKVNKRYGTPHWSLTFFVFGSIFLLIFQLGIIDLSFLLSLTLAIPGVVLAYIPITLEKKYPKLHESASFKLNRKVLMGLVIFNVAYSLLTIVAIILIAPNVVIFTGIFYLIAIAYYLVRKKWLASKGIDLNEVCKKLPEEVKEILD